MLGDGVYALTAEGDPNVGAVEGEDFLVAFEARATPVMARRWLDRLREHTAKPVRYLVLSHYHAVRTLGAAAFEATAVVAHERTRELIAERGQQDWESEAGRMPRLFQGAETIPGLTWPTLTFADRMTIELGGDRGTVELRHCGRGHTAGDIVAWLPRQGVLFAGDLVEAQAALYTGDAYHREWSAGTLDAVAAIGAGVLIGGRGAVVRGSAGVAAAIEQTRGFLATLLSEVDGVTDPRRLGQGGVRGRARRAGAPVRPLAHLRALPALRRPARLGRAGRHRAPAGVDRRPRPRGLGRAAGLSGGAGRRGRRRPGRAHAGRPVGPTRRARRPSWRPAAGCAARGPRRCACSGRRWRCGPGSASASRSPPAAPTGRSAGRTTGTGSSSAPRCRPAGTTTSRRSSTCPSPRWRRCCWPGPRGSGSPSTGNGR